MGSCFMEVNTTHGRQGIAGCVSIHDRLGSGDLEQGRGSDAPRAEVLELRDGLAQPKASHHRREEDIQDVAAGVAARCDPDCAKPQRQAISAEENHGGQPYCPAGEHALPDAGLQRKHTSPSAPQCC